MKINICMMMKEWYSGLGMKLTFDLTSNTEKRMECIVFNSYTGLAYLCKFFIVHGLWLIVNCLLYRTEHILQVWSSQGDVLILIIG